MSQSWQWMCQRSSLFLKIGRFQGKKVSRKQKLNMTHGPLKFKLIDKIFSVLYFNKTGSCLRGYRIIYQPMCTAPSRQWREHWSQTKCCRSRPNLRFSPLPPSPRMDQPSLNLPEFARHQTLRRLGPAFAQPLLGWFSSLVVLGSVSRLLNSEALGWWNEDYLLNHH